MSKLSSFAEYVQSDLLSSIPGISLKSMFGGYGLYKHGVIFGMIADDKLYFKVNETNQKEYEKYHSKPFEYSGHKGKTYSMSYWEVPDEILSDEDQLAQWIDISAQISRKVKKK